MVGLNGNIIDFRNIIVHSVLPFSNNLFPRAGLKLGENKVKDNIIYIIVCSAFTTVHDGKVQIWREVN